MTSRGLRALLLTGCLVIPGRLLPQVSLPDKEQILHQAHQAYYSLKDKGLRGFQCRVLPDWDSFYKGVPIDPIGEAARPFVEDVRFEVVVGPEGASTVSHHSDSAPPNEQTSARLRSMTGGVENMVTGFLKTWSQFMFASPVPDDSSEYQLEDVGGQYRISQKQGPLVAVTTMTRKFLITDVTVDSVELTGTVRPQFSSSDKGYILTGYEAQMKGVGKNAQTADVKMTIKIEYKEIEGMDLPATLKVLVTTPGSTVEIPISFDNCEVKKT